MKKFIISYITSDRLVVLNCIIEALSYKEMLEEITGEKPVLILSCVKA